MKKILITGGNGFFASRLFQFYRHQYQIFPASKKSLNILDKKKVYDAVELFQPDYVIHTAAIAVTDYCNQNPDICREINVTGTLNIAEACKQFKAKMIFISSEQVFNGNQESGPYGENDIAKPDTVYGQNKLESENLLKALIPELWILRFTWLFGMPEKNCSINANIFWDTIKAASKPNRQKVSCHEFRGFTDVNELVSQFHKVFNLPYGTYHIGSTNDLSRYDIVCFILKELGLEKQIHQIIEKDTDKYNKNPRDVRLKTDKIDALGFNFSNSTSAITKLIKDYPLRF